MLGEIDWLLTLAWWTFGVTFVTLILVGLSYRLQKRQHQAAPTGIEVSDRELFILRLIEEHGPLTMAYYHGEPGHETTAVTSWCSEGKGECVRAVNYVPGNQWFVDTINGLEARSLLTFEGGRARHTSDGGTVVRNERKRKLKEVPELQWMHR